MTVSDQVTIKSVNKEASKDDTMVYVKPYIKEGDLTKDDRELVNEGG